MLLLTIYHLVPAAQKDIQRTKKHRKWVDIMIQPLKKLYQSYSKHEAVLAATELNKKYGIWLPTSSRNCRKLKRNRGEKSKKGEEKSKEKSAKK